MTLRHLFSFSTEPCSVGKPETDLSLPLLADYALAREASTALGRNARNMQSPQALLETLFDEAKAGNHAARTIFRRAGRYLSLGLSNVVQLFDPEQIGRAHV